MKKIEFSDYNTYPSAKALIAELRMLTFTGKKYTIVLHQRTEDKISEKTVMQIIGGMDCYNGLLSQFRGDNMGRVEYSPNNPGDIKKVHMVTIEVS